jgi:predicted nuclease of restriction endonuclease-like RecB superfamily
VYLELMGYWSRDAVFRRVELVERGLEERIVFALSSKLRVSEQVLDSEHAALYVFRGKPSARAVEQKLNEVARRSSEAS